MGANPLPQEGAPTKPYKAIIAAVIAVAIIVVQVIQAQSADGTWDWNDWLVTGLALLGAVGVYFKSNPPA